MADPTAIGDRLDAAIARLAHESGARPLAVPAVISREILQRCSHFESFPGLAVPAGEEGAFLTPAACYHVYPTLRGCRLESPSLMTVVTTCGRNEQETAGRRRQFRMREVVFVGPFAWVSQQRDDWMTRALELAGASGLSGSLEPATDTFFVGQETAGAETGEVPGRGRRLLQQLKSLKYELRMEAGGDPLAVASFNLHESFFTSRFDIAMADGSPAASGCAAFGIERWALAYAARHHACL